MKRILLIFTIFLLALLNLILVSAQDEPVRDDSLLSSLSFGTESVIISSPTNDTDYLIVVSLPRDYDPSQSYPAVYLLDAWHTFGTVTDQVKLLSYGQGLPQIIVVGIWYPGELSEGFPYRVRDLCVWEQPEPFLEFLRDTLIPYIDGNYATDAEDRAIMGTSCGGDFALYSLFHAPGLFNRYLASSPGAGGRTATEVCIACELENNPDISGVVFLSAGSTGNLERASIRYIENTFSLLQELSHENINLTVSMHIFDDTDHGTVVPFALSRGLQNLYCIADQRPCRLISVRALDSIEDLDFPKGRTFITPDKPIPLSSKPSRIATVAGTCRNMEATVLHAVELPNGDVWIRLDCDDNVGWVQKARLQE